MPLTRLEYLKCKDEIDALENGLTYAANGRLALLRHRVSEYENRPLKVLQNLFAADKGFLFDINLISDEDAAAHAEEGKNAD